MSDSLALHLWALPRPRVAIVGDLILDVDLHGSCTRYAVESAGCPVFRQERFERREGGAGAVRVMLDGLGGDAVLVRGPRVSRKYRHWSDGRLLFRSDEDAAPLRPGEAACVARDVRAAVESASAVLVADYGKGVCTPEVLTAIAASGKPCITDPHSAADWSRYGGAIKCNAQEYRAAEKSVVIRTEAASGLTLFWAWCGGGEHLPARPRRAVDPTGCGDMVLAALGLCRAAGMDWPDACRVANAAAGLKVERLGAVPVSRAEVALDLLGGEKMVPAALLPAVRAAADVTGRRVAFTNGCFDVLHAGHVQYLQEARAQADVLVVGVNSDASVRRLKGPSRPANALTNRLAVLSALESVDYVVAFDEATPCELIHAVRPNVLVKGADYRRENVAGADYVESYGGRVHLAALREGCSTTSILARR